MLANILRIDRDNHRRLPDDSEQAQSFKLLARAHQDAIWDSQQITSKARSLLRQYFPAFLATFDDLTTLPSSDAPIGSSSTGLPTSSVNRWVRFRNIFRRKSRFSRAERPSTISPT
ncbi:IS110 family transposase [Rhodococcus erythropolis]|uniref:IS110 family transposase n=1 Tax=Rhodococcus erythropolis TaxID=1833 RepID=UPI0038299601